MSYGFKFLVLFLWVPGLILGTEPPPNAKTMNYKTCSTSECHKNIKDKKIIHGPTEANGCYLCHTPILGEHKYTLVKDSRKMCTSCHEDFETYTTNEKTGKPFITTELFTFATHPIEFENKKMACLTCHNPHTSENKGLLRDINNRDMPKELCVQCHKKELSKNKHPLVEKTCFDCHSFHRAKLESSLIKHRMHQDKKTPSLQEASFCLACHKNLKAKNIPQIKNMPDHPEILFSAVADFSGDPFKLMCHVCHNPNEGRKQDKFLTKQDTTMQLCATCHGKEGSKLYKNFHEVRKKLKNEKL
ncbi:MAG TPA: cytochrome c3 family protein [Bdellovibrionota bacterium]|nr:cytochrome c3 family protein [Bdellovibrionota bacterium]